MRYSIIIPMYNAAQYIVNTLNSILKNDMSDCEIIIVDDGSTDDCGRLAAEHLALAGICNYKVITKENAGVSAARNDGILASRGEYLIFCDSDDELEEGLIDEIDETYNDNNAVYDVVAWPFFNEQNGKKWQVCRASYRKEQDPDVYRAGEYNRNDFLKVHLLEGFKVRLGSFAVRRELVTSGNITFNEECTLGEDVEFFMTILLKSNLIYVADEPYYCYKKHAGSLAYSYNLRRFEAPLAMDRLSRLHETEMLKEDVREYIQNGLFVLHTIYALDSCISFAKDRQSISRLYEEYLSEYGEVEKKLREKMKVMKNPPYGVSFKRLLLLRISTKLYIKYIYSRQGK